MTDPIQQCPSAWTLQTRNSEPRRLCGKRSSGASCESAVYSTFSINYSHVCGRVIAYQYGSPDAFHESASQTIEGPYVDLVSVTHGSPVSRQHIWTFAAGLVESNPLLYPTNSRPCADRAILYIIIHAERQGINKQQQCSVNTHEYAPKSKEQYSTSTTIIVSN